eukprot:scaffold239535_cov22-Tisochrysis_lutea.AAC.1
MFAAKSRLWRSASTCEATSTRIGRSKACFLVWRGRAEAPPAVPVSRCTCINTYRATVSWALGNCYAWDEANKTMAPSVAPWEACTSCCCAVSEWPQGWPD